MREIEALAVTKEEATPEREKELRVAEKRSRYAQPKLHKVIDLKNYGAARGFPRMRRRKCFLFSETRRWSTGLWQP